jgi:hypothetical protein
MISYDNSTDAPRMASNNDMPLPRKVIRLVALLFALLGASQIATCRSADTSAGTAVAAGVPTLVVRHVGELTAADYGSIFNRITFNGQTWTFPISLGQLIDAGWVLSEGSYPATLDDDLAADDRGDLLLRLAGGGSGQTASLRVGVVNPTTEPMPIIDSEVLYIRLEEGSAETPYPGIHKGIQSAEVVAVFGEDSFADTENVTVHPSGDSLSNEQVSDLSAKPTGSYSRIKAYAIMYGAGVSAGLTDGVANGLL